MLELRMAGVGDLLFQVNHFFLFCARLELSPLIALPSGESRNLCELSDLFELFGFYRAGCVIESKPTVESKPFSDALNALASDDLIETRCFRFDNPCYGHAELEQLRANGAAHPSLLDVFGRSALYERVMQRRDSEDRCAVVVHVRRGDVARVPLRSVASLLVEGEHLSKVAHPSGVYSEDELERLLNPEAYRRFKSIAKYEAALVHELKRFDSGCRVCLLSDGFTRLASALMWEHRSIFRQGVSVDQLEEALACELEPLMQLSHLSLIRETADTLIESIVHGLSADMIISGSPGMFRLLVEFMQLDVEIVTVNLH